MHILKAVFRNTALFKKDLVIDFTNSDSVRRSSEDRDTDLKVFSIKPGVYTHVLMAFTGLNATGKTTVLEMLSMVSRILIDGEQLNAQSLLSILRKLWAHSSRGAESPLSWEVFFTHENKVYKLHSVIGREAEPDAGAFYYTDEALWEKSLASANHKTLFDFTEQQRKTTRAEESANPYLKKDTSIVASLGGFSEKLRAIDNNPIGNDTIMNVPYWVGTPTPEAIRLFDPNISDLAITENKDGALECQLNFRNQEEVIYGGSPFLLNQFLSAGTIRGLNIMPAIIRVLTNGGYVYVDEIENNFNKKIIEWFLALFTDTRTNPHGACLVFSTHYPELLDIFPRKDNIFLTRRDADYYCECVKYSSYITRNELSKGKAILENVVQGTAPRYKDLQAARKWVESIVKRGDPQ